MGGLQSALQWHCALSLGWGAATEGPLKCEVPSHVLGCIWFANGIIGAVMAASQILNRIGQGSCRDRRGSHTLLRLILRLSPALDERIMIGR
jgi:hypothetical protein